MKEERKTAKKLRKKPRRTTRFRHAMRIGGEHIYEERDLEEWRIEEWLEIYNKTWFGEEKVKKRKGGMIIV